MLVSRDNQSIKMKIAESKTKTKTKKQAPKHVVVLYVINNIYIYIHHVVVLDSKFTAL